VTVRVPTIEEQQVLTILAAHAEACITAGREVLAGAMSVHTRDGYAQWCRKWADVRDDAALARLTEGHRAGIPVITQWHTQITTLGPGQVDQLAAAGLLTRNTWHRSRGDARYRPTIRVEAAA